MQSITPQTVEIINSTVYPVNSNTASVILCPKGLIFSAFKFSYKYKKIILLKPVKAAKNIK